MHYDFSCRLLCLNCLINLQPIGTVRANIWSSCCTGSTIGSLGILLVAKQRGLIKEITPLLSLLENSDIYLSKYLIASVLELANES